ncbi:MAG TPA: hypothetical protein HPP77_04005 [Candidatus Hydrogenedentes bacterium]|nr:hypothetical protein [Candidatus Hydrogenedentota bacterium]HIJ73492.1 hypothetical protein [Candidatus Hydrogenedentota bacterium]
MSKSAASQFALVLVALVGCDSPLQSALQEIGGAKMSDEEQIAVVLDDVRRGAESRRIYKVLAHLSPGYLDAQMRDYQAARDELQRLFSSYREIRITRVRPRIIVQGTRARAIETFGIVAEPVNQEVGLPVSINGQAEVHFEKTNDVWQIIGWKSTR